MNDTCNAASKPSGIQPPNRIAVIAVHGVGDPQPGDSARNIAALLQCASASGDERYTTFTENSLEISVSMDRPEGYTASVDTRFSHRAMRDVADVEKVRRYRTFKLSGERISPQQGAKKVDVYEMYWGDLSRGSALTIRFLSELYQILFHLASLGRKTVIAAARAPRNKGRIGLTALSAVHRAIEVLLPTSIPLGNLFLLVPAMALLALFIPEGARLPLASLAAVMLVLGGACALFYFLKWRYFAVVAVAAAGAAGIALVEVTTDSYALLACAFTALGLILAYSAGRILLARYRSQVRNWATGAALVIVLALYGSAVYSTDHPLLSQDGMLTVSVFVLHVLFLLLQLMWLAAFVLFVAAFVLPLAIRGPEGRAARTGRIGVLISSTLFFVLTILLWSSFLHQVNNMADAVMKFPLDIPLDIPLLYSNAFCALTDPVSLGTYTECLFALTTGAAINIFVASVGLAILLGIACVLPSAWYEAQPLCGSPEQAGSATEKLRVWLDDSRVALWLIELILVLAWWGLALGYRPELVQHPLIDPASESWVRIAGGLLAAFIPIAVILRGQLPKVFGVVLDIALDVSNWLKERPKHKNPRGQILYRYRALLKEVIDSGQYDRIVIVSHSQGTVITADLLRLLHELRAWPFSLEKRPEIALLTAGSPLRQLYAARFPHWYGWANNPAPQSLGVETWVNIYRSGDYVGRKLWDATDIRADEVAWGKPQQDVLIGLGAHTHYFDHTAPGPREIIDWLISHPSPDGGMENRPEMDQALQEADSTTLRSA